MVNLKAELYRILSTDSKTKFKLWQLSQMRVEFSSNGIDCTSFNSLFKSRVALKNYNDVQRLKRISKEFKMSN